LIGGVVGATKPVDERFGCRTNPAVVDPCFEVDGRLEAAKEYPTFRLHKRRAKHVMGLLGGDAPIAPKCLTEVAGVDKRVDGKFVVCAFPRTRPEQMQMVCVEEVVSARVFESSAGGRWREHTTAPAHASMT
jgi:hypothetical protein